jgi:hypothetical protein
MDWRLTEAKKRFSELMNRVLTECPQRVLRGDDAVIVIAERDYERLTGTRPSFKRFLLGDGPKLDSVDLARDSLPDAGSQVVRFLLGKCVLSELPPRWGDAAARHAVHSFDSVCL